MSEDDINRRTMADVEADWQAQNEHLDYLGEILDEMEREAEIDVFHVHRPTLAHRLAYITEHVAHGSEYSLEAARRELKRASLETSGSVPSSVESKRASLARPRVGPTRTKRPA